MSSHSTNIKVAPRVIIVGAGLGGLSAAIQLKKQLRFYNFTIYEKADAIGGTWRDNTYPGCGSDVPGHWYSLSTELNPYWSSYFVNQPEIRSYWEDLYHRYDLPSHTKLGHAIIAAEWSSDLQVYKVTVENTKTREQSQIEAEIIFYAIGGFMSPMYPKDIPGADIFQGPVWHSARWRHDVDLAGKRVGVIGNGCSAAQFIPEITVDPSVEVINFCRTPQWFVPRGNYRYPRLLKWVFAHVPFVMRMYRNWIMGRSDILFLIFRKNNVRLLALTKRLLRGYIKKMAPKKQVDSLIPTYPPGCKRLIVDPGYLEALCRPNVSLRWETIEGIVKDGIRLKSGDVISLDVIIFGTGYSLEPVDLRVRGSKGITIHEYFANQGGATAYAGTCLPGFPNLFTLLGPNVASGHASVIFSQESQIGLALQLIKPVIDGQARSFEVTDDATNEYNAWLESRLSNSVWTECNSYYQVGGKKTKIFATFPGPVTLFWWLTRYPRWEKFHGVDAERWEKQRKLNRTKKWGALVVLAVAVGFGFFLDVGMEGLIGRVFERIKRILIVSVGHV